MHFRRTEASSLLAVLLVLIVLPGFVLLASGAVHHLSWWLSSLVAGVLITTSLVLLFGTLARLWVTALLGLPIMLALVLVQLLRIASFHVQGESFNESFFFHFSLNTVTKVGAAFLPQIVVSLITLGLIAWVLHRCLSVPRRHDRLTVSLMPVVAMVGLSIDPDFRDGFSYLKKQSELQAISKSDLLTLDTPRLAELGLHTQRFLEPYSFKTQPGARKNLVLIYLESLEQAFFDDKLFPGLMPQLSALRAGGRNYTQIEQANGTEFTIAGLVASQCGTPLLRIDNSERVNGNDLVKDGFLKRANCLGDILRANGYQQVYLGGADVQFAGKGAFLTAHGYDEVNGLEGLGPQLPPAAANPWGLYDDALFELAWARFEQLAQGEAPFNLTLLTLDTHIPARPSKSCNPYGARKNRDLDAAHCTDQVVGSFVRRLQAHPAWAQTVVVLMSDHLAFIPVVEKLLPTDYPRRLTVTVLNGGSSGNSVVAGTHMDIAPTLLDQLKIDYPRDYFLAGQSLEAPPAQRAPLSAAAQTERNDWLRIINTTMLSRERNFCRARPQVSLSQEGLHISHERISLTHLGWPLQPGELGPMNAFSAQVAQDGELSDLATIPSASLAQFLYDYGMEQVGAKEPQWLLLVTDPQFLPERIRSQVNTRSPELTILLMDDQLKVHAEGQAAPLDDGRALNLPACAKTLATGLATPPQDFVGQGFYALLQDKYRPCLASPPQLPSVTRGPDGELVSITLPVIHVQPHIRYSAVLKPNAKKEWVVTGLQQLDARAAQSSETPACGAVFNGSELLLPYVRDGEQYRSLVLPLTAHHEASGYFAFSQQPLQSVVTSSQANDVRH